MMKIVILDGFAENPGDLSWEPLRAFGEYTVYDRTPPELVLERAKDAEILVTNKTVLGKEILEKLDRLKFIALLSTGYNIVDGAYARERDIPVANIPAYSTESVAQTVFAFLLAFCRQIEPHSESVRRGDWAKSPDFCYTLSPLTDMEGKTLGIIGFGSIGKAVARIALAFGMKVIANSKSRSEGQEGEILFCDKDYLCQNSDFITIHCPLTEETEGMVNAKFLSQMKRTAYLINTSRGPVVDEIALAEALNSEKIAGAGLDVLAKEPPEAGNPLFTAKNCLITPHIAWAAKETRQRLMDIFLGNIQAFCEGKERNIVN